MATVDDLINAELTQLGYTEQPPGSNRTKFGDVFFPGQPAAWCAAFQSWALDQIGFPWPPDARYPGKGDPSVGFLKALAQKHGWWVASGPQRGDLVCFEWEADSWPDHIGIVEHVLDGDMISTIEGNSPGPDHTDEVAQHPRRLDATIAGFIRLPLDAVPAPPAPPPQPPQPVHPSGHPDLPAWMVLCQQPHGRPGVTCHGDFVGAYQQRMRDRGWTLGEVDGIFGPQTDGATRKFQKEKVLAIDGEVGPMTWSTAFRTDNVT
ncbi:MAG TPA: peptidoglycan-binding protein [Actinomycetota bacterium]